MKCLEPTKFILRKEHSASVDMVQKVCSSESTKLITHMQLQGKQHMGFNHTHFYTTVPQEVH